MKIVHGRLGNSVESNTRIALLLEDYLILKSIDTFDEVHVGIRQVN